MKKIIEYMILSDQNPHDLADNVQTTLSEGWQPFGPVTAIPSVYSVDAEVLEAPVFCQALVKYED
jgi:hypothetical protein